MRRVGLLLITLGLILLGASACSSEASPSSNAPTIPAGATSTSAAPVPDSLLAPNTSIAPTTSIAVPTSTTAVASAIEVVVANGELQTDLRHEVELGSSVVLAVTSDVNDEIHVHTYDVTADAIAGETVMMEFEASIPGIFEVELEGTHLQILELVVQ